MKYFFGFLAFVASIVVVVLLISGLVRSNRTTASNNLSHVSYDLLSTGASDSVVRFTATTPVVADEDYREIQITISKNARTVDIKKGYKGAVDKTQTMPNTKESYDAFLGALAAANYASVRDDQSLDMRKTCVTGNKYRYELSERGEKKVNSWTSTCGIKSGTFTGNVDGTSQLFKVQIPNYNEFAGSVGL